MNTTTTAAETPATTMLAIAAASTELAAGEIYAGLVLDQSGLPSHHLVLLPDAPATRVTWQQAIDWARDAGSSLPTRQELALLYANCKQHFDFDLYWSSEAHKANASYAWGQYFFYGFQGNYHKSSAERARAVRRIHLVD